MDLTGLIFLLLIAGVVLAFVPIDKTIRNLIICLIVIAVIVALLHGNPGHWHAWSW